MDKYLYNLLVTMMNNPDDRQSWQQGLSQGDFYDLVKSAKERGFIDGFTPHKDVQGNIAFAYVNPRVTLEGKSFIESVKSQQ